MKNSVFLIALFLTLSFDIHGQTFTEYLSHFRSVELPLTVERKTYNSVFYPEKEYSEIGKDFVKKFVCPNQGSHLVNSDEYRYDYGVKFEIGGNYQAVLVHKQKYEGLTLYDFDLSEILLIIYSKQGEILSLQSVGKDNDLWISKVQISAGDIRTTQIKILELNRPEMRCEIENKVYQVTKEGVIETVAQKPLEKGAVRWNEQAGDFELK